MKLVSVSLRDVLCWQDNELISDRLQAFRIRRAAQAGFAPAEVLGHPADRHQVPQLCQLLRSQSQQCPVRDHTQTYSHSADHQVGQLPWKNWFHQSKQKKSAPSILLNKHLHLSVDGRETRLDDNPSQELRRQFGELQKRVRALNNYTRFISR